MGRIGYLISQPELISAKHTISFCFLTDVEFGVNVPSEYVAKSIGGAVVPTPLSLSLTLFLCLSLPLSLPPLSLSIPCLTLGLLLTMVLGDPLQIRLPMQKRFNTHMHIDKVGAN